jgi:predicted nuclease of predicted toxin-antitoxin system
MKIIGENRDGFICEINREEAQILLTGDSHLGNQKIEMGTAFNISQVYRRMVNISKSLDTTSYDSVRKQLTELLDRLTPVEIFTKGVKEKVDKPK